MHRTLQPVAVALTAVAFVVTMTGNAPAQFSQPMTDEAEAGACQLTRIVDIRGNAPEIADTDNRTALLDILREAETAEINRNYERCAELLEEAQEMADRFLAESPDPAEEPDPGEDVEQDPTMDQDPAMDQDPSIGQEPGQDPGADGTVEPADPFETRP
jgi:hypothetical protein